MTANRNEEKIITAINNLKAQGITDFNASKISEQAQKDAGQRYNLMPYGELYRVLNVLETNKIISGKWEGEYPRTKVYKVVAQ